ncbi:L,D-transpeptidase family protein [Lachnospiraceae bacterium C1.1]|nr:peptidoglycan binding domain-containing protein [Lachnospiraceae bacterium C1.1]
MNNRQKSALTRVIVTIVAVLAVVYFAFSIYFIKHFIPGTSINQDKVAFMSVSAVESKFTDEANDFNITITGRNDKSGSIKGSAISLKPVFDGEIEELLSKQNAFSWPIGLVKKTSLSTDSVAEFDDLALETEFNALGFYEGEAEPVDAYISDYTDEGYTVIAEDEGSTLDKTKTLEALRSACGSLIENLDLDEAGCYLRPSIFSDDEKLNETAQNLNQYVTSKITYTFGDETEYLDGETIKDWLSVDGTSVSLDRAKAKEYVDTLARAHDTFGVSRSFKKTSGETITVSGGDYGWWMDRPSTVDELVAAINSGKQGEMVPVYFSTAQCYGDNDIGDTYVEVDLDNQHVYCYVSGNLVTQTDCVSGKVSTGNFTPDGTYAITYKEQDATLVGETYSSPVKYWMPFNGNIGLHDASWRSSFGGSIYLTGGSHGCVNLPSSAAKKIFENVHKGEAVVVYGGKQSVPKQEPTEEELQQQLLEQLMQQMTDAAAAGATGVTDTTVAADGSTTTVDGGAADGSANTENQAE